MQERKTIVIAAVRAFGTVNDAETLQKQLENLTALRTMFDVEG